MIEAKAKDLAVLKLERDLESLGFEHVLRVGGDEGLAARLVA